MKYKIFGFFAAGKRFFKKLKVKNKNENFKDKTVGSEKILFRVEKFK